MGDNTLCTAYYVDPSTETAETELYSRVHISTAFTTIVRTIENSDKNTTTATALNNKITALLKIVTELNI